MLTTILLVALRLVAVLVLTTIVARLFWELYKES